MKEINHGDRVKVLVDAPVWADGCFTAGDIGTVVSHVLNSEYAYVVRFDHARKPPTMQNGFAIVDSFYFRRGEVIKVSR